MNTVAPVAIAALLVCLGRFLIMTHTLATPVTTLEVFTDADLGCNEDGSAPLPIELVVGRSHLSVGEEGRPRRQVSDPGELRAPLEALQAARPERSLVKVFVEDDVEHARLVAVLDAVAERQLTFPVVVVEPPRPAPDPDDDSATLRALFGSSGGSSPL